VTSRPFGVSVSDIHSQAIECYPNLVEPLDSPVAPIGELVVSIPAPSCDHRTHEDPTLAKQLSINSRIVFADFFGRMGDVELDRSSATRLKVYEQQPSLRVQ
jgi:hypothetical protein